MAEWLANSFAGLVIGRRVRNRIRDHQVRNPSIAEILALEVAEVESLLRDSLLRRLLEAVEAVEEEKPDLAHIFDIDINVFLDDDNNTDNVATGPADSNNAAVVPARTFTRFRDLAPELRHMIYDWCVVAAAPKGRSLFRGDILDEGIGFPPPLIRASPPVMIQVCREARSYLTQKDPRKEKTQLTYHQLRQYKCNDNGVYVDWSRDTLKMIWYGNWEIQKHEFFQIRYLRHLSIRWDQCPGWGNMELAADQTIPGVLKDSIHWLSHFPHLETLTITVGFSHEEVAVDQREARRKRQDHKLRIIAGLVLTAFRDYSRQKPDWKAPKLKMERVMTVGPRYTVPDPYDMGEEDPEPEYVYKCYPDLW